MIYVHVPFCRSFCTYCDFYSEVLGRSCPNADIIEKYVSGVCSEAMSRRDEIAMSSNVNTLYIGGGTPSLLPPSAIGRIVSAVGGGPFEEFTVEVNPDDICGNGRAYVEELVSLGVNRVSMGVQSLDDGMLRWMNRRHDAASAREAYGILRGSGVRNVSLDIIFGISHMTDKMLSDTLDEVIGMGPEHISAYQLSIEEGSALAQMVEDGKYVEASDDKCRRQYDLICAKLRGAGYEHYEISNWARPGRRALHNSAYWTRKPYVGLGPGAHSLRKDAGGEVRSWNSETLAGWTTGCEHLSPEEILEERLMLGLRTSEGVDGRRIPEEDWFIADSIISGML